MRRCYRAAALVLGTILTTGLASFNSCSIGTLTAYAAEDVLTEELATAFQQEVQAGAENVETEIPAEEAAVQPIQEEPAAEEVVPEEPVPEESVPEMAPEEVPTEAAAANLNLDEQEYQVLLRIVEAEAGGEDTIGKMLVANVVMNRVRSGIFPATVTGVVYQNTECGAQFAPTVDGRIDRVNVSQDTTEAVNRVLGGEDVSQGALFFRSVRSTSSWFDQSLNRVLEHGNHIFYTL